MAHLIGFGAGGIITAAMYFVLQAESAGQISVQLSGLILFSTEFAIFGALIVFIRRQA